MTRVELVPRISGGPIARGRIVGELDGTTSDTVQVQWDDGLTSGVRTQFLRELPRVVIRSTVMPPRGIRPGWRSWRAASVTGSSINTSSFASALEWANTEAGQPWYGRRRTGR